MTRSSAWIQTASGKAFWPLDPNPAHVDIEDIAFALTQNCRFNGACWPFYSVGDHSIRVSELVPPCDQLWALLHDASEAYMPDLPRPLKLVMPEYLAAEERVQAAICVRFCLPIKMPVSVEKADAIMLVTEARDLMRTPPMPWEDRGVRPLDERITPRSSEQARVAFLNRFERLSRFVTT